MSLIKSNLCDSSVSQKYKSYLFPFGGYFELGVCLKSGFDFDWGFAIVLAEPCPQRTSVFPFSVFLIVVRWGVWPPASGEE